MNLGWDTLICDEAHRIKGPSGRASWNVMRVAKNIPRKIFLSGTPMPHSPADVYAQFRALDPSIFGTSYVRFKAHYCVMGGFENRQIVQFINMDELNKKFYSVSYRANKRDVVDLPPVMDEIRKCDIDASCKKIYTELENEFIVQVKNSEISVANALVKILRLSQLAGGYAQLDDGTHSIVDDNKINTTKEIIEDLPRGEPIVIFCRFRSEIERLKNMAAKIGRTAAELSGLANQLDLWKSGLFDVLVCQIQAGALGIDLTRACYVIYFAKGLSLGDYEQSRARVDRPGQKRPVTYYHVLARATIDIKSHRALKERKDVIEEVLREINPSLVRK
jgi:SNF2 family DNA or RNA helicase